MKTGGRKSVALPVKVYRRVRAFGSRGDGGLLAKFQVYLKDRPGSLAAFSSLIARSGGNIGFFHYDRALDSSRVAVEVQLKERQALEVLVDSLRQKRYAFERPVALKEDVEITSVENILEIKVRLQNRPGTLAAFSRLLKKHGANVIYMLYDEAIDPESADIALATKDPGEIDRLLGVINSKGYQYRVLYRGSERKQVEHIIGLKQVERFFLRLRHLLSDRDMEEIRAMVESSQELSADLVRFYSELGNNLEVADVFEKVLALASMAGTRIGERFSAREMPPLVLGGGVRFYGFRMPTSENVYVFRHEDELTMIDTGYGAYYDDIKRLLKKKSLDPAEVRRIFISHADADHAGASGYFAREFGARVFMHPASKAIIDNINRGHGAEGRMLSLNRYFSRLVNKFTRCLYPRHIRYFPGTPRGKVGAFSVIDTFSIGDLEFQVLESLGGHVQGQVFFLNQSHGLLFTSDYLIQKGSLSREDRDSLGVYSYLLISPNIDRQVYREETTALNSMIEGLARERKEALLVFPGHGDYYPSGA